MASVEQIQYLVAISDGSDLYTDHKNLVFIFDLLAIVPDLEKATVRKVLRFAVRLST